MKDLVLSLIYLVTVMALQTEAFTDPTDFKALEELFKSLKNPPQLVGWRSDGGDPCAESWKGVSCVGASVTILELHGLGLSGFIASVIHYLYNLKRLDISSNKITGEIPYLLPPNATHIDMSCNEIANSIPQCVGAMKHLQYLNLSRNMLSGAIGDIFTALHNLKQLDLSYNNSTDLPSSVGSLTNNNGLFLHNNQFTGSLTSQLGADKKWIVIIWIVIVAVAVFASCVISHHVAAQPEQKDHTPGVVQPRNVGATAQPGQQPVVAGATQPVVAGAPQPGQQAHIAGVAPSSSNLSPNPDVSPSTYISPMKKQNPFFNKFEFGGVQVYDGIKYHTASSRKEVMKLAYPERVEQPRRTMSFINEENEIEEYIVEDDNNEV